MAPPYPDESPFRGLFYKNVIVKARRWSYRVTYGIAGDVVWIHYLLPSWHPATHPNPAGPVGDDDDDDDE